MRRAETLKALPAHPSPYPTRKPTPIALSTGEELGAGFLAGALSRLVSTPLSVITVRMQAKRERGSQNPGLIAALRSIYREEGILGLWKGTHTHFALMYNCIVSSDTHPLLLGLESTLLLCSNPAITLFLFQLYGRFALRGRTPTAGQAFIGGAVSNALGEQPSKIHRTELSLEHLHSHPFDHGTHSHAMSQPLRCSIPPSSPRPSCKTSANRSLSPRPSKMS